MDTTLQNFWRPGKREDAATSAIDGECMVLEFMNCLCGGCHSSTS